jgi:hypothetical protein
MSMNLSRLLDNEPIGPSYKRNISVEEPRKNHLRQVRDAMRAQIAHAMSNWDVYIRKTALFEDTALASQMPAALTPKFRMQGSWNYKTLNDPAHKPPQQIDIDDGMFLPISFLTGEGRNRPAITSGGYFSLVEASLKPLCDKYGWKLDRKDSCVRVLIDDEAHADIALYAVSDNHFRTLVEKSSALNFSVASKKNPLSYSRKFYDALNSDDMMLAHRIEGWKPSDPRKLDEWFLNSVKHHGEQLRRVCRFMKGWRDYTWPTEADGGPCSISLMACVVQAYNDLNLSAYKGRDDLALLESASVAATLMGGRIENPVVPGQYFDEGWDDRGLRQSYVNAAKQFARNIQLAVDQTNKNLALSDMRRVLGDRIPNNVALITDENTVSNFAAILGTGRSAHTQRPAVKKSGPNKNA